MTNVTEFIMRHGLGVVIGLTPLMISLLLACFATSWRKWVSTILVLIAGSIFAFELYSGWLGGNLTGLIWIMSTPFIAVTLLALSAIEYLSRRTTAAKKGMQT